MNLLKENFEMKEKTILMTNSKKIHKEYPTFDLQFRDFCTTIKVLPVRTDTYILGVYLSADGSNKTTYQKIFKMLHYIIFLINKKCLTHDHVIYVINKVIILCIKYLAQHTFWNSTPLA